MSVDIAAGGKDARLAGFAADLHHAGVGLALSAIARDALAEMVDACREKMPDLAISPKRGNDVVAFKASKAFQGRAIEVRFNIYDDGTRVFCFHDFRKTAGDYTNWKAGSKVPAAAILQALAFHALDEPA